MKNSTIIFGGNTGIGYQIHRSLKNRGDKLISISRSNSNHNKKIKFEIGKDYNDELDKLIKNKFNYLIFAHRYRGADPIEEYKVMVLEIEKILEILMPKFKKEASVVILGSNAYKYIIGEQSGSYHYVRGAINTLVKYLAVKYGPYGIRVNSVLPSTILKKENVKYFKKEKKTINLVKKITPLKRIGNSKDISNVVEFLCSTKSSFITGQSIFVDGGESLLGQEKVAKLFD